MYIKFNNNKNTFDVFGSQNQLLHTGSGDPDAYFYKNFHLSPKDYIRMSDEDLMKLFGLQSKNAINNAEQYVQNQMRKQYGLS